jgi:hypothetical protein
VCHTLSDSFDLRSLIKHHTLKAISATSGARRNSSGGFEAKMHQAGGNFGTLGARRSFAGWEYIRGKGGVQTSDGAERGLELFVVKVNNRFERVAILESRRYCGGVSRYYASDRITYRSGIEDLLFSLRFADLSASVLTSGSTKGSGLAGVWTGVIQSTGAATGLRIDAFVPIFLTNGQVYFGPKFPTQGLKELNTRIPPELYARDWGTYTFNQGRGVMTMPYGTIPIRTEGNRLIVRTNQQDWSFEKLGQVDGAVFNGTYALRAVNGQIPSIVFSSDGRFTDSGALNVLFHLDNSCLNPAATPGSGRYEVRDYSATFTYSDGRTMTLAFLGTGFSKGDPSPASLRMGYNQDQLLRR